MLKQGLITTILVGLSSIALANPLDGLTVKVGVSVLNPTGESDLAGGAVKDARATNEVNFTPSLDYRIANTPFSVELLLAAPFDQQVKVGGLGEIAELKHLPPTITAKYHLPTFSGFTPYAGVGVTVFVPWNEDSPLGKLEADLAAGAAAQVGFNFQPADAKSWGVYGDVRYADLKTDLKLGGADIGSLDINPLVVTLGYSFKF
ncbi:MAG: OmpW family protein [Acinetobacter sp.]|jgi:outer membrane protein|nr:MAG: OmpW family protein [Acinetobacter sp.]